MIHYIEEAMHQVVKVVLMSLLAIAVVTAYLCYNDNTLLLMMYDINARQVDSIKMHQATIKEQHVYSDLHDHEISQAPMLSEELNHHEFIPPESATPVTVAPEQLPTPEEGYLLPYSIYEEQTNAAKNLWQLQIFAKQVEMQVVEPFAKDSFFVMSGIAPNFNQALRFDDYVDKDKWNNMVTRDGGTPLVSWEEFITKAPRKMIILHTVKNEDKTIKTPLTIAYDENTTVCKTERQIASTDMHWIKETFNVIKMVCYLCTTHSPHPLSIENFISSVLIGSDVKSNQVTVMIVNWLGIRKTRVHLLPIKIFTTVLHQKFTFPPSKRVMTAYKAYVQQYIGDHKYVGIVFRTHHVLYFSPLTGSFANHTKYLLHCSKTLGKVLDKVRRKWKIFLAYDMGMFGSKNYVTKYNLASLQEQIFLDVFNGSLQVNEREQNLINTAGGVTDTGVIAQLEKVIATNADCIILLGPHSTFVQSAVKLYSMIHQTNRCIISICFEQVFDHRRVISSHNIPDKFLSN